MKQYNDNKIKLAYQAPALCIEQCAVESPLLGNSIVIDSSSPVEDEGDIGFAKEECFDSENFWD
ncbi:MAG: hypothetical protein J5486_09325 [Bacteroidaceae bacterium]|nr:hypothetical protein [Bacteroidaceae bacterium]